VSLIDLPPTLLKAAEIKIPDFMKGNPLQNSLDDERKKPWPQEVFVQISESQVGRAIRTSKWKYSVVSPKQKGQWDGFLYSKSNCYEEEYLYDLEHDMYEKNNLVEEAEFEGIRNELAEILKRKMKEAGEEIPDIIPKMK
jgi:uncharacterized sulfatase